MTLFVIARKRMHASLHFPIVHACNYLCSTTTNYSRPSSSFGQSESSDIRSEEPENGNDAEDEDTSLETLVNFLLSFKNYQHYLGMLIPPVSQVHPGRPLPSKCLPETSVAHQHA